MLKTSAGKLYTLLSACKPDNARVRRRLIITEIIEMPEYKALQVYSGAASAMDDHYSADKLQQATYEQLREIKKIIPFLEDCIRKLYELICYGDIRVLFSLKEIDFYNSESMQSLYQLVLGQPKNGINITNIAEFDVWSIFDKKTITKLDNVLSMFDMSDVESLEIQIVDILSYYTYCISAADIAEKRNKYRDIYRQKETIRVRLQIVENKIFVKKLIFSFVSIMIVMIQFLGSRAGINSVLSIVLCILYMIGLAAYWIVG